MINPESILLWAMNQWYVARKLAKQYRAQGWTKTHGYFIQMGGFVLYEGSVRKEVLTPEKLATLLAEGMVKVPTVKEEDLQDRSKGDGISKAVVLIQTAWFTTQCIAQLVSPCVLITHLEIVTLALAVLNSAMYFFWWNKPLDVHWTVPVYLESPSKGEKPSKNTDDRDPGPVESAALLSGSLSESRSQLADSSRRHDEIEAGELDSYELTARSKIEENMNHQVETREKMGVPAFGSFVFKVGSSGSKSRWDKFAKIFSYTLTYFISALLGLIHCIGFVAGVGFATTTEAIIWGICAAVVIGLSLITGLLLLILLCKGTGTERAKRWAFTRKIIFYVLMAARLGFFVIALMDLRDLPPAALYVRTWTFFIPHI
jgi:hypothetical protein